MMSNVSEHIKKCAMMIIEEGLNREDEHLIEIVNFEWQLVTNRPFTNGDIFDARHWVYAKLMEVEE